MARNFGRFASVPIGPQLALQGAGLVLTTNAVAAGQARQGRSDIAISTGTRGAEFAFWGDDAVSAIVGVVPGVSAVNQSPTAAGVGWRLATGEVGSPSGNLATGLPAVAAGDIVGVRVAVGSPSTITFYRNGIQVWSGAYALGAGLVFAVSLTATKAGGLNCAVNAGQWQAQSPAAQAGWYSDAAGLAPVRVADYDFLSASSDSPAHARYEGLIAEGLLVAAEIGFWPWGGEMPANSASASCSIVDGDGILDAIAAQDLGGVAVAVRSGIVDGTVAAASTVARFVLDRIDITGEGAKSIVLRDAHDDLDQTLARGVFLPNIPTLAWSPLPVVIGAVASVPGLPVNTDGTANLGGATWATAATEFEIGEIVIMPAVTVRLAEGWGIARLDPSAHTRTRGSQVSTVQATSFRRFMGSLAGAPTADARGGGLANGDDWETIAAMLTGGRRCVVIPQYRTLPGGVFDAALCNRTALYGLALEFPGPQNIQRQYFSGTLTVEEIPP